MLLLITIIINCILVGAEVDIFVPSFPELQEVFHLSPFMVELTLAVNLWAHCFACLIVGNLGDRYGSRPVILTGLVIFVIGSLFCAFAPNYTYMLFGRFLQGAGIAGSSVLSYVVIANAYSTEKQQEILGMINGLITLAMAFAPVVGSYISLYFHWQGNFIALLAMGVISLLCSYCFIPKDKSNPHVSLSLKEYGAVFASPKTTLFICTICAACLPYWIFVGISPILYMDALGVDLRQFGFYQGAIAFVFSVSSFSSGYFIRQYSQKTCFYFGIIVVAISIGLELLLVIFRVHDPIIITLVQMSLSVGLIFPFNILYPMSFHDLPEAKGKTNALIMGTRMMFTGVGLQFVSYFYSGTFRELGLTMAALLLLTFWLGYKLVYKERIIDRLTSTKSQN